MTIITDYHQQTKHSLQAYAKGPETLDWDDQPSQFRYFEGCTIQPLSKPGKQREVTWAELTSNTVLPAMEMNIANLSLLLELSFGLSAWKQYGPDRWAVRNNPSSGNLHPTEVYVVNGISDLMPQGVYHYVSHDHHLEQRCSFENVQLEHSLLIGISSVHWREAWKYGERAYRYCQLDTGHAIAALSYAAACLGWRVEVLAQYSDNDVSNLLGLDTPDTFIANEKETPELICRLYYTDEADYFSDEFIEQTALLDTLQTALWQGKAKSLGAYHMFKWPIIDKVSFGAQKLRMPEEKWQVPTAQLLVSNCDVAATSLIRQRRSAQRFIPNMDAISNTAFKRILSSLSASNQLPFSAWLWQPAVHICLFVHNVEDLAPGLYCLPRAPEGLSLLQSSLDSDFLWQSVAEFPALYLLKQGDVRQMAKTLSCHQAIASDGEFSVAMLAEFKVNIAEQAWYYRRLFWECGMLGQVLYMEAEAAKVRGTGIGCFFDDGVHSVLGIKDDTLQSLYHFTVGHPFEDARIQSFPAYAHLNAM